MARTTEQKYQTVLRKNTYFDFNRVFEAYYNESIVGAMQAMLDNLRREVQKQGFATPEMYDELLRKPQGLGALLALTGFSQEKLRRLITVVRLVDDESLSALLHKADWSEQDEDVTAISDWGFPKIERLTLEDPAFRMGIVNLFFKGRENIVLNETLPPFDLRKLDVRKLEFHVDTLLDSLVRYKLYGSYNAQADNNAERLLKTILDDLDVPYVRGDLDRLKAHVPDEKRTMDFIIPDQNNPQIIIECSFLTTTSSGQGDKAKTEASITRLIREHYPNALFIGFVDGAGWYARKGDLHRMVQAFDDVFTFHQDELQRFTELISEVIQHDDTQDELHSSGGLPGSDEDTTR